MTAGQELLSSLFHRPIEFCHNPTFMSSEDDTFGYIGDLTQCTSQKLGKITYEVEELVKHLREAIEKVGKYGKVIHIAHSQGALITYLACKRLKKEEMKQMEVICFGGAEVIRSSDEYPFHRCINYYSVNDPLLFVVPKAARALRSGFMGMGYGNISKGRRLSRLDSTNNSNNSNNHDADDDDSAWMTMMMMQDPNAEPEFVFLTPREGDPVKDHGLFGKTYLDALRWEGRRYQTLYLPIWHPITYMACTHGCEIAHVLHEKLVLYFKALLRHTILRFVQFVMYVNQWMKEHVVVPLAIFLIMLWEKIRDMGKMLRGEDDDVYQPVVSTSIGAGASDGATVGVSLM